MHLLDIFFAPRLKGIGKLHLYDFMPAKLGETKVYKILPDGTVNELLIEGQWEDMLRLMVSLKLKQVTAWQVLKRLSAYMRQRPLYRALKEFGRLVKTGFILRHYDEPTLRQSIEKQLSRIELVNRFNKAVFFGGNQVFGVAAKEEQEKIIHARRLIQNAIILWNYGTGHPDLPIRTAFPNQRTATAGVNAGYGSQRHGNRLASCQSTK